MVQVVVVGLLEHAEPVADLGRRAGQQVIEDVEVVLALALPDQPRLLEQVALDGGADHLQVKIVRRIVNRFVNRV